MINNLSVSEKLLLLAVRPIKGGLTGMTWQTLDFALTGAALLEMTLTGNVSIRGKKVELLSAKSDSPLHAYLLAKLGRSSRPRRIRHWLEPIFVSKKKIKDEIYRSLVEKREIRLEYHRFLFIKWEKPFLSPGNHAYDLIDKIKNMVYQDTLDPKDVFLLALLEPAGLLKRIYPDRSLRKSARFRIRQFLEKNATSETVSEACEIANAVKDAIVSARAASRVAVT